MYARTVTKAAPPDSFITSTVPPMPLGISNTTPRFLLSHQSSTRRVLCERVSCPSSAIRHASRAKPAAVPVLEKPARFNPPSHGARLRRDPPRYAGPQLSQEERDAQRTRKYPNMMPAEGTFLHWFLNNRAIHLYITMGTLCSLAGYSFLLSFKQSTKFADMLPSASDMIMHPIQSTRACLEVLRLHQIQISEETAERRRRRVEDVKKRSDYRKTHGLETEAFGGWTEKTDTEVLGPAIKLETENAGPSGSGVESQPTTVEPAPVQKERRQVKKWLGIW